MGHSQYGEDQFIAGFFKQNPPRSKIFCDVGAFNGVDNSNTRDLYTQGWWGILVEPHPVFYQHLADLYKGTQCITVNSAVGDAKSRKSQIDLCIPEHVSGWQLQISTCLEIEKERWPEVLVWTRVSVPLMPLSQVLGYSNGPVDFLSIDCEGMDLEVLESGELWKLKDKPLLIMLEHNCNRHKTLEHSDLFLRGLGYTKVYDNGCNAAWTRP